MKLKKCSILIRSFRCCLFSCFCSGVSFTSFDDLWGSIAEIWMDVMPTYPKSAAIRTGVGIGRRCRLNKAKSWCLPRQNEVRITRPSSWLKRTCVFMWWCLCLPEYHNFCFFLDAEQDFLLRLQWPSWSVSPVDTTHSFSAKKTRRKRWGHPQPVWWFYMPCFRLLHNSQQYGNRFGTPGCILTSLKYEPHHSDAMGDRIPS